MAEDEDIFESTTDLMTWIWRLLIITIIVVCIWIFTFVYLSKDINPSDIEINSFKNRLLFSPNCLAYTENNIVSPGIVDLTKFENVNLNKCYQKNNFEFGLKLLDLNKNEIKSIQSNPAMLKNQDICNAYNTQCSNLKEYVLIKNKDEENPAILDIILIKNE